jgi:hypothetical protein
MLNLELAPWETDTLPADDDEATPEKVTDEATPDEDEETDEDDEQPDTDAYERRFSLPDSNEDTDG